MTQEHAPCPTCGYPLPEAPCQLCEGTIRSVDGLSTMQPGRRFFVAEILEGFTSMFTASLLLMTKKEFMGKLGLAIFVNLVIACLVAALGIWGLYGVFSDLFAASEGPVEGFWAGLLEGVKTYGSFAIATVLTFVSAWFLFPALIEAGMGPFLDPLANATEQMLAGESMEPVEIGLWRGLMAGINAAAQILVLQIFLLVPVLILGLIPLIGPFFLVIGVILSAYLNSIIWFEIPAMRRGYGMKYRKRIVRKNWGRALGFGLAFNLGMLVPVFNFLFLGPAAAVAVSLLYLRFEKRV